MSPLRSQSRQVVHVLFVKLYCWRWPDKLNWLSATDRCYLTNSVLTTHSSAADNRKESCLTHHSIQFEDALTLIPQTGIGFPISGPLASTPAMDQSGPLAASFWKPRRAIRTARKLPASATSERPGPGRRFGALNRVRWPADTIHGEAAAAQDPA